uniref:DUF6824 domain-containing protein n=1 Tax=Ditylum brightwellii TaxID=49249 RepID=A0A7S4S1U2_9STRA
MMSIVSPVKLPSATSSSSLLRSSEPSSLPLSSLPADEKEYVYANSMPSERKYVINSSTTTLEEEKKENAAANYKKKHNDVVKKESFMPWSLPQTSSSMPLEQKHQQSQQTRKPKQQQQQQKAPPHHEREDNMFEDFLRPIPNLSISVDDTSNNDEKVKSKTYQPPSFVKQRRTQSKSRFPLPKMRPNKIKSTLIFSAKKDKEARTTASLDLDDRGHSDDNVDDDNEDDDHASPNDDMPTHSPLPPTQPKSSTITAPALLPTEETNAKRKSLSNRSSSSSLLSGQLIPIPRQPPNVPPLPQKAINTAIERTSEMSPEIPHDHDILLGRQHMRHPGNINYRYVINHYKQSYISAIGTEKDVGEKMKRHKTKIVQKVRDWVYSLDPPGRFLQETTTGSKDDNSVHWILVEDDVILRKIAQQLRDGANKLRKELGIESVTLPAINKNEEEVMDEEENNDNYDLEEEIKDGEIVTRHRNKRRKSKITPKKKNKNKKEKDVLPLKEHTTPQKKEHDLEFVSIKKEEQLLPQGDIKRQEQLKKKTKKEHNDLVVSTTELDLCSSITPSPSLSSPPPSPSKKKKKKKRKRITQAKRSRVPTSPRKQQQEESSLPQPVPLSKSNEHDNNAASVNDDDATPVSSEVKENVFSDKQMEQVSAI